MSRTDADYEVARAAFSSAPWAAPRHIRIWDGYLFEDCLELYVGRGMTSDFALDLEKVPVGVVEVHLRKRASPDASRSIPVLQVSGGKSLQELRVVNGDSENLVEVSLQSIRPEACVHLIGEGAGSDQGPSIMLKGGVELDLSASDLVLNVSMTGVSCRRMNLVNCIAYVRRPVDVLRVEGRCEVSLDPSAFSQVVLAHEASLDLTGRNQRSGPLDVQTDRLEVEDDGSGDGGSASIGGNVRLSANDLHRAHLDLALDTELRINASTSDLRLTGDGAFSLRGTAFDVEFVEENDEILDLELRPWAVLQEASGAVALGQCANAQINGKSGVGLTIRTPDSKTEDLAWASGARLRNVHVPVTLEGLQSIEVLTSTASVVTPALTDDLPGGGHERGLLMTTRERVTRRWHHLRTGSLSIDPLEHLRADYASALARLADRRGAPGSVRTRLWWMDYRMRQSTATGRVEWLSLAAYRMVGYGERAAPPFALFAILAAVFSMIGLACTRSPDLSVSGVVNALEYLVDWLTAPLHVLRLAERGEIPLGRSRWAFAGKVAIAVPFLTGVFAARKYVKRTADTAASA